MPRRRPVAESVRTLVCALLTVCVCLYGSGAGASPASDIRVYSIHADVFEYTFTSVAGKRGGGDLLAFNDLSGNTEFVRVGDTLGPYRVKSFTPRTVEVFQPTLNKMRREVSGVVTLESSDGAVVELNMGTALERDGKMACLVSVSSGGWHYARDGDDVMLGDAPVSVRVGDDGSVSFQEDGGMRSVTTISGDEKTELEALWARRREEARARAETARKAETKPVEWLEPKKRRVPSRVTRVAPVRMFVGTEYRFPTEYEAIPQVYRDGSGTLRVQPLVVPRRFKTRSPGMDVRYE